MILHLKFVRQFIPFIHIKGFPGDATGKEPTYQYARDIRDVSSIPGSERSPGEGSGNPLQYSCLENSMDRGGHSPWDCKESDMIE